MCGLARLKSRRLRPWLLSAPVVRRVHAHIDVLTIACVPSSRRATNTHDGMMSTHVMASCDDMGRETDDVMRKGRETVDVMRKGRETDDVMRKGRETDDVMTWAEKLETVYLEHSPLQSNHLYTVKLLQLVSSLTQLDANYIARQ